MGDALFTGMTTFGGIAGMIKDLPSSTEKRGDYIIGIQIPFNSTIGSSDGDKYVAKNFFMPTGKHETVSNKHPSKALDASTKPTNTNDANDRAFIKGAVTKATFVQIGGEPLYQFNIQFVPVDKIA